MDKSGRLPYDTGIRGRHGQRRYESTHIGDVQDGRKPVINKAKAEAVLIKAKEKSDDFKRLFTNAVMLYESLQVFERSQQ